MGGDEDVLYSGTPYVGTVVAFRYSANDDGAPVVVTDDERMGNARLAHFWEAPGRRAPDPFRDTMVRAGESWVKQYDQTPNPAHAALVEAATKRAHRQRSRMGHFNSLPWWLSDCCAPDIEAFTSNAHLFASWNLWAEAHSGRLLPEEWLPQELENRGFRPGRHDGADGVFGLRLQDDVAERLPEAAARPPAAANPESRTVQGVLALVGLATAVVLIAAATGAWRTIFG